MTAKLYEGKHYPKYFLNEGRKTVPYEFFNSFDLQYHNRGANDDN